MSFPKYPKYKDSGVEWLGQVPEHWETRRIGDISTLRGRLGWQGLKAEEYTDSGPYVVSSAHFSDTVIQWEMCPRVSIKRYETDSNIQLAANDVLLMKDGAAMGKMAFLDVLPGPACLNSHLLIFRPTFQNSQASYHPRFFFYRLNAKLFQEHIKINGTGATFLGISQEAIARYRLHCPPVREQTQIAAFLDRETAKIDALVAEQQRLIELLKEKRQALISHAVTKGLNPHAPMKPSGIEWLGDVPAHWDVSRIKRVAQMESGHTPDKKIPDYWENGNIPWVSLNDTGYLKDHDYISETTYSITQLGIENSSARILPTQTVIFSRDATIGRCAITSRPMAVSQHYIGWICSSRILPLYLLFCLRSMIQELNRLSTGATLKTIGMPDVRTLTITLPPMEEQTTILQLIAVGTHELDSLTAEAQRAIDLLQERRTALISAAVTGQIDVRGAA